MAANTSYNTIGENDNSLVLGPTLAVGKQFFDKKLRTNFSSSYNTSYTNGERQSSIYNFRLGGNYVWSQKHNFSLNLLALFRNTTLANNNDFTVTLGYTYTFDNFKLNLRRGDRISKDRNSRERENTLSFRYRNVSYSGTIPELNEQLTNVFQSSPFVGIPQFKKDELTILLATVKELKKEDSYKENALLFLEELYAYGDFQDIYNDALFSVIKNIQNDMKRIDLRLERLFVAKKLEVDEHHLAEKPKEDYTEADKESLPEYNTLLVEQQDRLEKLVGHRWMERQFAVFTDIEVIEKAKGYLREFKDRMSAKSYRLYDQTGNLDELETYLENEIIDFYFKKSLDIVNPDTFELKYINKN